MTQREEAIKGNVTEAMRKVAKVEHRDISVILDGLANGIIAIPRNPNHRNCRPIGVGKGLKIKVNANIGNSADYPNMADELEKLKVCLEAKADTVMDLSTGGDITAIRQAIIAECPIPLGTVPIYQAVAEKKMTVDGMFSVVEQQAEEGVDFMTIHCGVTRKTIQALKDHPRLMQVVSRGWDAARLNCRCWGCGADRGA